MPDIAAVAAELAELDVVAVRSAALLEDKDELVLAAVQRTHTGIVLDPDAEVFQFAIGFRTCGQQLVEVAPVHADVVQRPSCTEGGQVPQSLTKKGGEFGLVHLTHGHRERAMVDRAEPAHIAVDFHVVRRVGKGRRGVFLAHQRREGQSIEGAAAQQPMVAEEPEIAPLADRRRGPGVMKPVTSRLKSSPLSERSLSCSASSRLSQVAISVSLLSEIMKARTCAGVR